MAGDGTPSGTPIVRYEAGEGTGDQIIVAADGTRWLVVERHTEPRPTGERRGVHTSERVYDI